LRIQDLGAEIRAARLARGLTQARLAAEAGLSRKTLNLLENGRVGDLGVRKVLAVLEKLGVELRADSGHEQERRRKPDYVRMACTSASVSYRTVLTEEELIHALLTGRVPAGRQAHLRTLLDEAPPALLAGLAAEAARWTRPGKLERNLARLARAVGASRKIEEWLKTG
jgi:transcriptional regulator with XRE-family HTH domain